MDFAKGIKIALARFNELYGTEALYWAIIVFGVVTIGLTADGAVSVSVGFALQVIGMLLLLSLLPKWSWVLFISTPSLLIMMSVGLISVTVAILAHTVISGFWCFIVLGARE